MKMMSDAAAPGAESRNGTLMVLESYPADLPTDGPALPEGTPWFDAACRRWQVPRELLSTTRRINALPRPPRGDWLPIAQQRVAAALSSVRPNRIVAAGWVARDAVCAVIGVHETICWSQPRVIHVRGLGPTEFIAVPHPSGRCRLLNCPELRAATSRALRQTLVGPPRR